MPGQFAGQIVGSYRLEELLSCGGYGQVYKALQLTPEVNPGLAPVAVKLQILKSPHARRAFWQEVHFYRKAGEQESWLPHFIASSTEVLCVNDCEDAEVGWIVVELLGSDLHSFRKKIVGSFDIFKRLSLSCLHAVKKLHEMNLIHCDIKPNNFILEVDGPPGIRLVDFGLVQPSGQIQTCLQGTMDYASTRQLLRQPLNGFDDLQSLGYTLLAMWLGYLPWSWEEYVQCQCPSSFDISSPVSNDFKEYTSWIAFRKDRLKVLRAEGMLPYFLNCWLCYVDCFTFGFEPTSSTYEFLAELLMEQQKASGKVAVPVKLMKNEP